MNTPGPEISARRRPPAATRRFGYVVAAAVNVVLLYLVNIRPGWSVVPFLTDDTGRVIGLVNISLAAGVITSLVYLAYDPPWVKGSATSRPRRSPSRCSSGSGRYFRLTSPDPRSTGR